MDDSDDEQKIKLNQKGDSDLGRLRIPDGLCLCYAAFKEELETKEGQDFAECQINCRIILNDENPALLRSFERTDASQFIESFDSIRK